MTWRIEQGNCIAVMATMPAESVDAIVTDPPYGLGFMGRAWDTLPPGLPWGQECLRLLKPGGHLLAFGGTRTSHRLVCAIEDAGFEIRDIDGCRIATNGDSLDGGRISSSTEGWDRPYKRDPETRAAHVLAGAAKVAHAEQAGRWPANVILSHSPGCREVGTRRVRGDNRATGNGTRPAGFANIGSGAGDGEPNGAVYGDAEVTAWDWRRGLRRSPAGRADGGSDNIHAVPLSARGDDRHQHRWRRTALGGLVVTLTAELENGCE